LLRPRLLFAQGARAFLACLTSDATSVPDLSLVICRFVPCAGGAVKCAVREVVGAKLVQWDEVFIDDEIGSQLLSAGSTASLLIKHKLRELHPREAPARNGKG